MSRLIVFSPDEINAFDKPPRFTEAQRQKYFHINDRVRFLLSKLRKESYQTCLLLQWGYFRASGRFFMVADFHKADVKYVCKRLNLPYSSKYLTDYQAKRKTQHRHKTNILSIMGFHALDANEKNWLDKQLEELLKKQMQPRDIIYHLAAQCHQQKIEIPSYHYLSERITQFYNKVERKYLQLVEQNITDLQIQALTELINGKGDSSLISQWKAHNQKQQVKAIRAEISVFLDIKACFYSIEPLLGHLNLSTHSTEYYAGWVTKAKTSQLKQIPNRNKLYLYLVAFVQHQFYIRQDTLVDVFLRSVRTSCNQAQKKRLSHEQSKREERLAAIKVLVEENERLDVLLASIALIINEDSLPDSKKVKDVKALLQPHSKAQEEVEDHYAEGRQKTISQLLNDSEFYDVLETLSLALQRRVSGIVKAIDFDAKSSEPSLLEAIEHYKDTDGQLTSKIPVDFLSSKEQKVCLGKKNEIRTSLYKILLFIKMADGVKAGKLNLQHSHRYKAIQDYLISETEWNSHRESLLNAAGLKYFSHVDTVLSDLKKLLDTSYHRVNTRILCGDNKYIRFDNDGRYILDTPKITKKSTDAISTLLSDTGSVPIIQIMDDVDRIAQFTGCFHHYSVKHSKLKPTSKTIIAGIMAKGHNIGVNKIGQISVGINNNTLRQTVNWFFTEKNIQVANNKIIATINKLILRKAFKHDSTATHTASDGQKYQVAVDSILANYSFKYFGKNKGVSLYTFVDDTHTLFYSTVISASEREAVYVIDGLLHNNVIKSDIHSTDTHGFTESIFAATHFIGTSFAPRLKKISRQNIYAFSARQTYAKLGYKLLPSRPINQKLIKNHWDDILRFMVTIKLKEADASTLFKRLSSYAKDHPLYKAIKEFGRIIKSQFILTYVDDLILRQRIEKQLNKVELSNKFSRAVFFERDHEFTVATRGEQEIVAGCKSLIQNAIILWNYLYLSQLIVNAKKEQDTGAILSIIRNGSMMTWQHVNMRGEYDFTKSFKSAHFDMEQILKLRIDRETVTTDSA